MVALSLLFLLLAPAALASPSRYHGRRGNFHGQCSDPVSALKLPSNFDPLPGPPNFVLVGYGIQNYTCDTTGTPVSIGAIGQMFDMSCLYGTNEFDTIQDDVYGVWAACTDDMDPLNPVITQQISDMFNIGPAGQHYFSMVNGALEAVWDLTSSGPYAGNKDAIVFAHKIKTSASPSGPDNILWVELVRDSGDLANTIYRTDTVKGQPPSTCNPGETISVKYATKYLLI